MKSFILINLVLFFQYFAIGQSQNPIIKSNQLIEKIENELKKNKFKITLNEKWSTNEGGTEVDFITNYSIIHYSLTEGLNVREIKVNQYETFVYMKQYFLGNQLFYGYYHSSSEGCDYQHKIYFENQGSNPVKMLLNFNNCSGAKGTKFIEVKNENEKSEYLQNFSNYLFTINEKIDQLEYEKEEAPETYELRKEISTINSHVDLYQFVQKHSPSFEDLDSLYTIITGQICPKNLSYNLANGDSTLTSYVPTLFLNLLFRNVIWDFEKNQKEINSIYQYDYFNPLGETFSTTSNKVLLTEKYDLKIPDFAIIKMAYSLPLEMVTVTNNMKKWYKNYSRYRINSDYSDLTYKPCFTYYQVKEPFDLEGDQGINKQAMINALGKSLVSQNIASFISAQVFTDLGFFYINQRWVFFDLSR